MPGPQPAPHLGEVTNVMKECVHECSVAVPGSGVDDHARFLVHHQERFVLPHDAQRDVLREELDRLTRRYLQPNDLSGAQTLGLPLRKSSVHQHVTCVDEPLHAASRQGAPLREQCVEPLPFIALLDRERPDASFSHAWKDR